MRLISTDVITLDPQKVKAILEWSNPSDKKVVQRFVGFTNFYRRFVKNFSAIIAPITQVTHQLTQFQWSSETQAALDKLKTLFILAPVLQVDASEVATGAIMLLYQGPKALLYPVAFSSQKMSQPERNYMSGSKRYWP